MPGAWLLALAMAAGVVPATVTTPAAQPLCRNGFVLAQDKTLLRFDEDAHGYAKIADLPKPLNALGYFDDYVYAISGGQTVTVDAAGQVTAVGPAIVPSAYAGAVSGDDWLLLDGSSLVDVQLPALKVVRRVQLSDQIDLGDWAVNPLDGALYGLAASPTRLVRVDPSSGAMTSAALPTVDGVAFGAVSVSAFGVLLALENSTGRIYHIPLSDPGHATFTEAGVTAYHADAAACPVLWDYGSSENADAPRNTVTTLGALSIGGVVGSDDGLAAAPAIAAEATAFQVTVAVRNTTPESALLAGWLGGVRATASVPPGATSAELRWPEVAVPRTARSLRLLLRLYAGSPAVVQPTGSASGGEVEEYAVGIRWPQPAPYIPPSPPPPTPSLAPPSVAPSHVDPSPVALAAVRRPPPPPPPKRKLPLTLTFFAGLLVPAITLAARVRR
ncbi:MAG: hypothetical protein HOU81_04165 [Hamadaea sp.]|uniref:DUF6923 family protein n=1 Tax=Hamadaea sp. TaxID=2024425 RepID=UPI00180B4AFB|nr:hypothetical protein [Hamadaea sp.]NUR69993.1 hypothetical protein [Hamadaea sp.]NUT19701.1 hypothetical protein [Hamadaea sp.]